ncbi:MAG: hypothetical protein FJZ96_02085 [Chloroflexi bacterium]|nr:hypothetical protein [Chloroflexota bacterium]
MTGKKNHLLFHLLPIILVTGLLLSMLPAWNPAQAQTSDNEPPKQTLYAYVDAPAGIVTRPYVILSAFGSLPQSTALELAGVVGAGDEFICPGTPCELTVSTDSVIRFWAYTSQGDRSPEYKATVRITTPVPGGYKMEVEAIEPDLYYADSCAPIWDMYSVQAPGWAGMPRTPSELHTEDTLHYLAGRLIDRGVVDASSCPNGGLEGSAPNGCGIELARQAMIEWQNRYDFDLWLAGKNLGISPYILKTLLLRESQFWPGRSRYFVLEYGLAQINDFGADVALRWDYALYQEVCDGLLSNCDVPYMSRSASSRAMLRGALIRRVAAECPTCEYGLDMDIAHSSIDTIGRTLRANCSETRLILFYNKSANPSYEDLWKFTLVSYHSGYYCLDSAIKSVIAKGQRVEWSTVSQQLTCPGALKYVDDFWNMLTSLENRIVPPGEYETAVVLSVPPPPPTVAPTATPAPSTAKVWVHVYIDKNNNNRLDYGEGVSGVPVQLTLANGAVIFDDTTIGMVTFDLAGKEAGQRIVVSLLGYYRSESIILPQEGDVLVAFKFTQPGLPTRVP